MVRISTRLRLAVAQARLNGLRQYAIARGAGLHPTVVSALLNGAIPTSMDDARVIRLGAAVGLRPGECFERVKERRA